MKAIVLFVFYWGLINSSFTHAQSLSFQINSIGNNPNMTTSSLSFQVENMANCIFLANGLSIYKPITTNVNFQKGCSVPIQFDHFGLKLYPQPMGDHPRIQLTKAQIPNCNFTIRIYNIEGRLVFEEMKTGLALSTGSIINTSKLFAGVYIVQVISENSIDIIQAIKQD
jgi:hypothetical protein